MNVLYRVMVIAAICLCAVNTEVRAESEHPFSALYVFGDSLSDPGNAFAITGDTANPPFDPIPSAAYGVGGHHFSNGRTWVEVMAQRMGLNQGAKPAFRDPAFGNYAFAGARAMTVTSPGFDTQVQMYLGVHGCVPQPDALYVVQFGGNDLRDALDAAAMGQDPAPILGNAIMAIVQNIGILAACGAEHFLIANAPNLGAAPAVAPEFKTLVARMSFQFNQILAGTLAAYFPSGLNFYDLDMFGFVTAASAMPEGFGFTNGTTPCLTFGVTNGAFCKERDAYLFWDAIHPTKTAHRLLGEIALGALPDSR
ncbi:MAG: SGNH/GDSL hydrolase family protein [Gammaproteobacteria bacterium]|nr:SGNH/GDSL hydrolase family protein [Gammaproteobacteria bacterium]